MKDGDTLRSIADAFNLDIVSLISLNGIGDPDLIRPGSRLRVSGVPSTSSSAASAPQSAPTRASAPAAAPTPTPRPAPAPAAASAPASGGRVVTAMVTYYWPGAGASSSRTASGTTTHWGTVAADTRLFPFGTRLRIQGMGDTVFTVEDTGSAVRGNVFDVWYPDAASARGMGPGNRQVTILGPGD